eukprot:jgi/Mesen1/9723/ME000695S09040
MQRLHAAAPSCKVHIMPPNASPAIIRSGDWDAPAHHQPKHPRGAAAKLTLGAPLRRCHSTRVGSNYTPEDLTPKILAATPWSPTKTNFSDAQIEAFGQRKIAFRGLEPPAPGSSGSEYSMIFSKARSLRGEGRSAPILPTYGAVDALNTRVDSYEAPAQA